MSFVKHGRPVPGLQEKWLKSFDAIVQTVSKSLNFIQKVKTISKFIHSMVIFQTYLNQLSKDGGVKSSPKGDGSILRAHSLILSN